MKRMVQTIRNILICIILVIIYLYWNGYYLSKEKCIEDSMRSLYVPDGERILEICNRGFCKTLVDHGDSFSLIGTKKQWIFYRVWNSATQCSLKDEHSFSHWTGYSRDFGSLTVVHRNNPKIEFVHIVLNSDETLVLNQWKDDYVVFLRQNVDDMDASGFYQAFDESGNLIEEIGYFCVHN